MDTLNTYEELKKENAFNDKQAKTLTKVLASLVTKDYLEERLNNLRKDIHLEIKDLKISMYVVAITMTGVIVAAMKLL